MKNTLPKSVENFIVQSITSLLSQTDSFEIIIFESYSTGKNTDRSDIDIAIKAPHPLDLATWEKIEEVFENSDLAQEIDILDYHRVQPDFRTIIDQTGIVLFTR